MIVYVPGVLELGVTTPVELANVNPAVEEYVPPVYAFVPVKVGFAVAAVEQKGVPE